MFLDHFFGKNGILFVAFQAKKVGSCPLGKFCPPLEKSLRTPMGRIDKVLGLRSISSPSKKASKSKWEVSIFRHEAIDIFDIEKNWFSFGVYWNVELFSNSLNL